MNALDIFFVIVLGFFLFRGIYRGMILEIASIAGLVAGFVVANQFYMEVYPWVHEVITNQSWAQIVSYLGVFLVTLTGVALLAFLLRNLLRMILLGWLDRLGGGILGLAKAGLICVLTLLFLMVFLPQDSEIVAASEIAPYIMNISETLANYLPQELREEFGEKLEALIESGIQGGQELFNTNG